MYQFFHNTDNVYNIVTYTIFTIKSAYQNPFWRIMWNWSNDAENSALPSHD